jgi:hypothetical protein
MVAEVWEGVTLGLFSDPQALKVSTKPTTAIVPTFAYKPYSGVT